MTTQDSQDRTATGQTNRQTIPKVVNGLPKDNARYWESRLAKRNYVDRSGEVVQVPEWQVRLFHAGREGWFNLGTANKTAAGVKARDIWVFLRSNGWDATLAKFKPKAEEQNGVTVGGYLDHVKAVSGLKPGTFEIYAKKFRTLVAGVFGIKGGEEKHDYTHGGTSEWLNRVHAVKLDRLTPKAINRWVVQQLEAASKNPLKLKHSRSTVRSILISSKALFANKFRQHVTLRLPSPLPFEGVTLPKASKSRYKSEINPALILMAAKRELAEGITGEKQPVNPRPELYKILLLALGAGLRRDEIDKLQWKQILWDRNLIRIETTEIGSTKSEESEQDVAVDPGLLEILKSYMPKPGKGSPFVIESPVKPRPESVKNHHYRANRLFRDLILWLRGKGLSARNALHALRKEFGSVICQQAGIYAASAALRHSSITLTREYYVDNKQPAVFQVSKLLGEPTTEEPAAAVAQTGVAR